MEQALTHPHVLVFNSGAPRMELENLLSRYRLPLGHVGNRRSSRQGGHVHQDIQAADFSERRGLVQVSFSERLALQLSL